MDRLTALTVFRQAVDLGSFAAVARRLGLSPAAVSKNIGELEAHLGVRLLNRTTRRMSLTEAGSLYYDRIARALDDITEADLSLGSLQEEPRGLLRVTAPVTLTLLTPLSTAIPEFLRRHPELTLDLRLDDRQVDMVEEGFDVAIRGSGTVADSSLVSRRLLSTPYVVCAAPSYLARSGTPQEPEDLGTHSCILFAFATRPDEWAFRRGDRSLRVPVSGRYRVGSSLAIRDALHAGFGLGLMPRIYVEDDLANGSLRAVLGDWSAGELSVQALYPSRRHVPAKVRAFLDFVVAALSGRS